MNNINKENLDIVYLSKSYQEYIKPFCSEHQLLDKGERRRPFLGTVLTGFNGYDYFVPLTSSERTLIQNKQIDIFPINKGKNGTLNFNLMIPVPKGEIISFEIDKMPKCPSRDMFAAQRRHIIRQSGNIKKNAAEVYLRSIYAPNNNLAQRCNDFILLEEKCEDWVKQKESAKKNEATKGNENKKDNKDMASADEYKKTSVYKKAVEKYGQKVADKMVAELLKQALTQEKNEGKKTDSAQSTPTVATDKKTTKEISSTSKKKSASAEKSTVTTVTIKSSQKGK